MVDHAGVEHVGVFIEEIGDLDVVEEVVGFVLRGLRRMEVRGEAL